MKREDLIYETHQLTCSFCQFQTIRSLGRNICNRKINLDEANQNESDLLVEIMNVNKKRRPTNPEKKTAKNKYNWKFVQIFWRYRKFS